MRRPRQSNPLEVWFVSSVAHGEVAHHFESAEQQRSAGKLGMWIFLSTEILLFGGLFCAYAIYRAGHPEIFFWGHRFLSKPLGATNTAVLICSSLTMAWAVRCAQTGQQKRLILFLSLTFGLATAFLGIKFVEYEAKWKEGLLWGQRYHYKPEVHETGPAPITAYHATAPPMAPVTSPPAATTKPPETATTTTTTAAVSRPTTTTATTAGASQATTTTAGKPAPTPLPAIGAPGHERSTIAPAPLGPPGLAATFKHPETAAEAAPKNVQIFFGIYFLMTGLHAIHVIAGMIMICWLLSRALRRHFGPHNFVAVDLGGLYWHLVDIIWIYLFPLLYLIR